jgi:hypothetical protein
METKNTYIISKSQVSPIFAHHGKRVIGGPLDGKVFLTFAGVPNGGQQFEGVLQYADPAPGISYDTITFEDLMNSGL